MWNSTNSIWIKNQFSNPIVDGFKIDKQRIPATVRIVNQINVLGVTTKTDSCLVRTV